MATTRRSRLDPESGLAIGVADAILQTFAVDLKRVVVAKQFERKLTRAAARIRGDFGPVKNRIAHRALRVFQLNTISVVSL